MTRYGSGATGRSVLRTVGIGILGVVGGLLFAIIVQDLIARVLRDVEAAPTVLGLALGFLLPGCSVVGAVLAIWIDRRRPRSWRSGNGN